VEVARLVFMGGEPGSLCAVGPFGQQKSTRTGKIADPISTPSPR
jgi:hypothetical protein